MKVLVTGAAGFIGSNLVRYLCSVKPEWKICALDMLTYAGNLNNISDLIEQEKIRFEKHDIANESVIKDLFEEAKFDLVFHLAAESHVDRSIHSASEFVRTNVMGTQSLLNAALETNVQRFVHISTDEVYGSLGPSGCFYEETPLDPTSPYAASKASSDLMVLSFAKTHKMDAVITRCTNNYGPYQFPEKFIPLFISNALENKELPLYGDGMNVRSWIFVTDHCEALLKVAEAGKSGQVYNIGGGPDGEIPNKEVAGRLLTLLSKPETLIRYVTDRPAHDRRYAVSISKISSQLGWTPRISFEEGLKRTVKWYLDNQDWWRAIKSGDYLTYYEKNYSSR
jgi:dTDP-glucose 4,6-dehydratase